MRWVAAFLFLVPVARGQTAFVQQFYDWYVKHGTTMDSVLARRQSALSAPLLAALKADLVASAKNPNEVVGLDFDPFVGSQDPCERYVVGKSEGSRVSVYGICDGKKNATPDVVAEVAPKGESWVFVNFRYQNTTDLVSVLKQLASDRKKRP